MGVVKRIRLDPAQRRDQLLELGVKMLSLRGLEQISVDEIAKMAGISRGLLFHYFPSKRDFHVEIVRHSSNELLQQLLPNPELGPFDMLTDVMNRYVDYVTEHRDGYVSLLRGPASGDPEMRSIAEENRSVLVERILSNVPLGGADVTPRIRLAVRGWIAFVEEATLSWLNDPQLAREELVDLHVSSLPAVALGPEIAAALLGPSAS
ncbi:TetR/AcrR family transcriptional regulator [Antrihabitans sp. YC3-6]|uniref:TetR/AcrR family transcriptional regulator n=1 Tax=Antrihabitans stalagmiti TaxID=2799499 RepID=A0A934NTE3_9NOCA|nr:TetR/AcrR family transcriptional regulator [Antrihabitans stalagmiti]MBJ8340969.1 TetR/AcrR family transcriptional regulator [Antrihabitans stalagmiti]